MNNKIRAGKVTLATAAIVTLIGFSTLAPAKTVPASYMVINPEPTQILKMKDIEVGKRKLDLPKKQVATENEEKGKIEVASIKIDIESKKEEIKEESKKLSNDEVADLVIEGKYGNGAERQSRLTKEGYDYKEIQRIVEDKTPKTTRVSVPKQNNSQPANQPVVAPANGKVIKAFPHDTFKSYIRWTALSRSSPQGQLCAKATADPSTAIMKYNGRYLVALGFAYSDRIGEEIDIVMESGQVIPAIVGDWKAREHTDSNNSASLNNGSIVEFIVSSNEAANRAVNGSGNYNTIFPGKVKEFRKR